MFRIARRANRLSDVRFCDSGAEVTTAADRACRHHDRTVTRALAQAWPR